MEVLILALLGSALVGVSFLNTTDETDEEPAPEQAFVGTDGNDTLVPPEGELLEFETIDLGAGDDTADLEDYVLTELDGGDGDDSIVVDALGATIDGGAGDDVMVVNGGNEVLGGEGNDTIDIPQNTGGDYPRTQANGGDGDDVITATGDAFYDTMYLGGDSGSVLTGGAGADTFNVVYQVGIVNPDGPSESYYNSLVSIADFDPSEDTLVVEIETSDTELERDVDAQMEQIDNGDGTYTSIITLTLTKEGMDDGVTELTVTSNAPFALDDVQFVGV